MIDTTLLIDYFRKTDKSRSRFVQLTEEFDQLVMSAATEFEVYSGATKMQLSFWNELLSEVLVLPFDSAAAHMLLTYNRI